MLEGEEGTAVCDEERARERGAALYPRDLPKREYGEGLRKPCPRVEQWDTSTEVEHEARGQSLDSLMSEYRRILCLDQR